MPVDPLTNPLDPPEEEEPEEPQEELPSAFPDKAPPPEQPAKKVAKPKPQANKPKKETKPPEGLLYSLAAIALVVIILWVVGTAISNVKARQLAVATPVPEVKVVKEVVEVVITATPNEESVSQPETEESVRQPEVRVITTTPLPASQVPTPTPQPPTPVPTNTPLPPTPMPTDEPVPVVEAKPPSGDRIITINFWDQLPDSYGRIVFSNTSSLWVADGVTLTGKNNPWSETLGVWGPGMYHLPEAAPTSDAIGYVKIECPAGLADGEIVAKLWENNPQEDDRFGYGWEFRIFADGTYEYIAP